MATQPVDFFFYIIELWLQDIRLKRNIQQRMDNSYKIYIYLSVFTSFFTENH